MGFKNARHGVGPQPFREVAMYKHILLAYDGSEPGQKALLDSVDIAQWSHADLALVAVMPNASSLLVGSMEGGVFVAPETEREREAYQAILDEVLGYTLKLMRFNGVQ